MENKPDVNLDIHTMPDNGTHDCSAECWCNPELVDDFTDEGGVKHYLHRDLQ